SPSTSALFPYTTLFRSYIPKCEAPHVADYLAARYDCMVDVEELKEDEEAPVILKNNPFSMNMEGIVESYGLPHKGELDPTTIMRSEEHTSELQSRFDLV